MQTAPSLSYAWHFILWIVANLSLCLCVITLNAYYSINIVYFILYLMKQINQCNTRTVCLCNTNAYFLQMAARGERNIESNQFAIDVSHCTLCQVQKLVVCYKQFRKEVSTCLHIYIYILSLIM